MKTLAKEHGLIKVVQAPPGVWQLDPTFPYTSWRTLTTRTFVSSTYFDLAGMSLQEKTLFFEGAAVQNWIAPEIQGQVGTGDSIMVLDFMTSSPLDDTQLVSLFSGNFAEQGQLTFHQTIYGRIREYVADVDTNGWQGMVLVNDQQVGSLEATASDRVYSYSLLGLLRTPFGASTVQLSPCRHLLRTEAREEKDYEYLMRLKRSYELQQEPDVDKP